MSLFEYGNLSLDIDFTDVDFYEKIEAANDTLQRDCMRVSPAGKTSERLSQMVQAYDNFFTSIFGKENVDKMFGGKRSGAQRIEALNLLTELSKKQGTELNNSVQQYRPNRQQRRHGK